MEINSKDWYKISEARSILEKNGIPWTEVWIRIQVGKGVIKSKKVFSSRLIPKEELARIINERRLNAIN